MSNIKNLLALAILACLACSAFAVKCYMCNSLTNPKCGEMFEKEDAMKIDCARIAPPRYLQTLFTVRNATGCMKQTLEAVALNGHPQIVRSCFFGDISNTQLGCTEDSSLPFIKQKSCDVCAGDLCNSSTSIAPIAFTLVAFFALARLFS